MTTDVTFTLPHRKLGNTDLEFLVKQNGEVVGKLLVSKGAIVWRSKSKKIGKKLGWRKFDEVMNELGRCEIRKKVRS